MKTENICKTFAIAGAAICGTAVEALVFSRVSTQGYLNSLVIALPLGIGVASYFKGAAAYFSRNNNFTREVGKGALVGAAFGATGIYGWAGALSAGVGYAAGAAVGLVAESLIKLYHPRRPNSSPNP